MADKTHDFDTLHTKEIYVSKRYTDSQEYSTGHHVIKYKFKINVPAGVKYVVTIGAKAKAENVEG